MQLGIIMDPISQIIVKKDTSFALLLEAQARGHALYYMEPQDVSLQDGTVWGCMSQLHVKDDPTHWYTVSDQETRALHDLDLLLMRKDPPFNMDYIYLTYLLEQAEQQGLCVINKPASLRDANEKLFAAEFVPCCPKTVVSSQIDQLHAFASAEKDIILKPLGGMGGQSVFWLKQGDPNLNVILEMMTEGGTQLIMAQRYIPEAKKGDKRVLMINGEPIAQALLRVPSEQDFRGNLASGARGLGAELSERDHWICEQVGPALRQKGLFFAGLDIVGDYLTEINVTSPTGLREIDAIFKVNIAARFFDAVESYR